MTTPEGGWVVGGVALYLHRPVGHRDVGIFIQYGDDKPIRLGSFVDERHAQGFKDWIDAGLTAVGLANAELVRRLEEPRG